MITHIVMWTLKDVAEGQNKAANAADMKARLLALPARIDCLREMRVAVGQEIFEAAPATDIVLYATFDTREDLLAYAEHPAHQALVGFVKSIAVERRVVDFET